jgi:hypothetical protein
MFQIPISSDVIDAYSALVKTNSYFVDSNF